MDSTRSGAGAERRGGARSLVHHVRPRGLSAFTARPAAPRGRSPRPAAPAWCAFPGAAAAATDAAAAVAATAAAVTATSAFGSRIRNPCAGLTMKQSSNVPAFLSKLWTLVEETHTNEFITWSQVGSGTGTRWPRVPLVEPTRLGSARPGWVGLGWAGLGGSRGLRRRAASPPRADPRLCVRGEPGPSGSVLLRPRAVGEGRPGNGPAGPGSSEPARAARSAHSSSVVCSPRGVEVAEPRAGERASERATVLI